MKLSHALRLGKTPRLALVGAGGKTSALFSLAREYAQRGAPVLVTTTTHLFHEQASLGDFHLQVANDSEVELLPSDFSPGIWVVTGEPAGDGRVEALPPVLLERLFTAAKEQDIPLLVEADGSRQLPLKAPAAHEPAIPSFVDTVVVVAGLSGLGKPLDPAWVHRPEVFASLAGVKMGAEITIEVVARVLMHEQGGVKGIPPNARCIALLNQADTPELRGQAQRLASLLLPEFTTVVSSALEHEEGALAAYEPVAGVVLAAGSSERLGRPKQTLEFQGEPLVRRAARTALQAGLSPVVVVTGAHKALVSTALDGLPVEIAHNPHWEAGMSTSLRAGIRSLPEYTGACVFLMSDQPFASETLVRRLVEEHAQTLAPIVAPQAGGRRANPVLFDCSTFSDLLAVEGDMGGRTLFSRYRPVWLPWHDERLLLDVDTEQDYLRLLTLDG